jgi:DNA-binding MurR/RpiR family transcriptional regulator
MDLSAFGFSDAAEMRPSERKVAEILLADPEWFSRATLSEIAARADVSEPTVLRFTRSLGSRGFQDFRYTLIQSLASPPVGVHSLIDESDPLPTVITKTLDASINALTSLRDSLNVETFALVADAIGSASDLVVLGFGASGIVGQDLAQKFPLFGLPINAPADAHQQFMAATLARPSTVVIAISNTAATIEVLNSAREARARGATVVALSGREGPLTEIADLVLLAGGDEDTNEYTPTSSRLAHLAVVDALSVVVALRRGRESNGDLRRMKHRLSEMRTSGQTPTGGAPTA